MARDRIPSGYGKDRVIVSRAYLLVLVPAAIVGISYFFVFHSFGMAIHPWPFLGTLGIFIVALLLVRYYHGTKPRRSSRF